MERLYKIFSSSKLFLILLFIFGVAMAVATFVENDFGTSAAWVMIYDAWWFELVMAGLSLTFLANIFKYKLLRKEKWAILAFHLAFIIIILGAAITRYTSYGGVMRIREGESSNILISDTNYLNAEISDGKQTKVISEKLSFSTLKNNDFSIKTDFNGKKITIDYKDFIPDAVADVVEDKENGKPLLELVVTQGDGRSSIFLTEGETQKLNPEFEIGFQSDKKDIVNIIQENGQFKVLSPKELSFFIMNEQRTGVLKADSLQDITLRTLYRSGDVSFVPLTFHQHGKFEIKSTAEKLKDNSETQDDALLVKLSVDDQSEEVNILYRKGFIPLASDATINDVDVKLSYGSKAIEIPFKIRLNDFQLERYPGSSSPSSYASEVTILDGEEQIPYRIFMNNVLDYKGYRFFQASYDTDERGTVLSVNHDFWGTWVTYFGYFLMTVGMIFTLFGKKSRFNIVGNKLKKLKQIAPLFFLFLLSFVNAQEQEKSNRFAINDTIILSQEIDKDLAEQFGRLLVQDLDGRIKPINTLASEIIRKISRKSYFFYPTSDGKFTLDVNQTFLAMHTAPNLWQHIPLIEIDLYKIEESYPNLKKGKNGWLAFSDLLNEKGDYILSDKVEEANQKKPAERNEFDKEILKLDEKFNILYNLFIGNYLKVLPNKEDDNNTWYSFTHDFKNFPQEDAQFAEHILPAYFNDLAKRDYEAASEKLNYIKTYQDVIGEKIIPSPERLEAELWYNRLNLNFWLFQILFTLGFVMLILAIIKMFNHSKIIQFFWNLLVILILLSFIAFVGNVILRWYVAQHAPWSNGYEMLVFVALILLLSGLVTFRKSDFSLPLATLFSGALLLVSWLDWINPEITNLMPVLKSYWLKIHVATIVSGYAPLAFSAVLGLMVLLFYIFRTEKNKAIIDLKIRELTYINEMSMTVGLFLLTVGTFLGGIWANESWGRYWAWDPKETWALISVIVYAIVLHLRFVPKLGNHYVLNTASMFAFWSIIMTSFGVNYYLSGLHSYASGDPMPIPKFVYFVAGAMIIIAVWAGIKNKKKRMK